LSGRRWALLTLTGLAVLLVAAVLTVVGLTRNPQTAMEAWRELDVSILHKLLLEEIMEISEEKIDHLENIKYLREPDMGYDEVSETETSFLFILNATRIEQVKACTKAGEKMPQKSTDFYPKVITGFVMLPIGPEEEI